MDKKIITFNLIYKFYSLMRKKSELLKYYSEDSIKANKIDYEPCYDAIESISFDTVSGFETTPESTINLDIKNSPIDLVMIAVDKEAE